MPTWPWAQPPSTPQAHHLQASSPPVLQSRLHAHTSPYFVHVCMCGCLERMACQACVWPTSERAGS